MGMRDELVLRVVEAGQAELYAYAWVSLACGLDERLCAYLRYDDGSWAWRAGVPEPELPEGLAQKWERQRDALLERAWREGEVIRLRDD